MITSKRPDESGAGETGLLRTALALLPPLGALVVQLTFWPYIEPFGWFLFYPSVFLSCWIGGRRGGLLATLLSTGLVWFFFIPPRYSFAVENPAHILSMVVFVGMGVVFSFFHHRLRQANRLATEALLGVTSTNDGLEVRVSERTAELAHSNDALRATEALLRTVTDEARVGLVLVSAEHRYLFANAAHNEMLGLGDHDIVGKRVADVLANVYESQIRPRLDRAFAGERVSYKLRRPPLPGTSDERLYAVTYEPRTDASSPPQVVVVIYDITEGKRTEQAVAESQRLLQAVADNSTAIIWVKSVEGRYLLIDGRYQEAFHADRTGIIGKTDYDLFSGDQADAYRAVDQKALASGTATQAEEVVLLDDGAHTFLSMKCPLRDETGKVYALCGISTDITERKQALEALRRSDQQYHLLFDTMPHGSVYRDADGGIISMNPAAERILGQTKDELLGLTSASVEHPTLREDGSPFPGSEHPSMVALYTGRTVQGTVMAIFNPREGAYRWISIDAVPLFREGADKPYQVYTVFEDTTERKRANLELYESEQKLRLFIEHTPAAIVMFDRDMRYLAASRRWIIDYGLAERDIVGRSHYEIFPEIPEHWKAVHRRCLAGATERCDEEPFQRLDGSVSWVRWEALPWRERGGAVGGIIIASEDITARKRAEAALSDSEAKYRTLLESMTDGVFVAQDYRFVFANPALPPMLGYAEDELVGMPFDCIVAPEFLELWTQWFSQRVGDGIEPVRHYELRFVRKGGGTIWVELRASRVSFEGKPAVLGIIRDISERKHAEQALLQERTVLRTLIDALPDVVFTKDAEARYVTCNAAELRNLGAQSEEEVIGKTAFDFYERKFAERYHADDLRVLSGEAVVNQEEPGVDASGSAHWYLTIKVPLRNQAGEVTGLVGISRDITERRRAEESLRRTQKLEALGTLAGGIAHDFNNLLLAITGNARLAMAEIGADSPAQESIAEIGKAGTRAADLVKRILAFSRPEEPQRQVLPLQPIVEEALHLLRSTLPAMIEIKSRVAPGIPPVVADPSQVHQIVMNLVTNAAHAIGTDVGQIEIGLDALTAGADLVQATPDLNEGRYVRLSVSDSGCGMDTATLERIFDPFFTTKRAGEGTGLGLSVVHGIMRSHDGAVNVYSQPGKGTTFRLYFPAAGEIDAAAVGPTTSAAPRGRGERVLYVDDESALVLLATRVLQRLGYQVAGYTEPRQALQAFESNPQDFDVLITDLSMPALSGFDLVRRIRAVRPDIPVVMTSGYVRPEDQETALSIGVQELILKPDTIDALGEVLSRLLRSPRESDQSHV